MDALADIRSAVTEAFRYPLAGRPLESLLRPDQRRDFRGAIVVHDCEADDLRPVVAGGHSTRVHPTLVETDLIVTVGAGESVLHGGATALVDASVPGTMRAARTV